MLHTESFERGKTMRKKELLLILLGNTVLLTAMEDASAPPADAVTLSKRDEPAFKAWQEEQEQTRLREQVARQDAAGLPPYRGISAISAAVPRQAWQVQHSPSEPTPPPRRRRGHRRERSHSDPSLLVSEAAAEETHGARPPGYSLIPTGANTDQLLALANRELEATVAMLKELTDTLGSELHEAALRHQGITAGTLSPSLPKRSTFKKGWDFVRGRTKADLRAQALKIQTREAAKTEQASREAITPLVARVLRVKDKAQDLQQEIIDTARKSEEKHRKIRERTQSFHATHGYHDEGGLRQRTQSMYIPRSAQRQHSSQAGELSSSNPY